jgi:hypothetical protein
MEIWEALSDEERRMIEEGEAAMTVLCRHEAIEQWYRAGLGWITMQQAAMHCANTNKPTGRGYNAAWDALSNRNPQLRDRGRDKAARSHAVWMATNWEAVNRWLQTLPMNVRVSLNHPRSVRRKFDLAHKVQPVADPMENPPPPKPARIDLQDQVTRLQEELDARDDPKAGVYIKKGMPVEEMADIINDVVYTSQATIGKLIAALQQRKDSAEKFDAICRMKNNKKPK